MNFLALSPLATSVLAVVTAAALAATYFLKLRHRRLMVSSSLLWSRVLAKREERSLWEKLRRLLSILLAVTIGLLIVFALARPVFNNGAATRIAIVLDTSPSMLARMSDGRTRWQHATDAAISLIDAQQAGVQFRVAGTSALFDFPFTDDVKSVRRAIESMQPVASSPRFPEIDPAAKTDFFSDGVAPPIVPQGVTKQLVYEPARNVAISAFEVRAAPTAAPAYEAYLEVTNYGSDVRKTSIQLREGGPGSMSRETEIRPGESFSTVFDLAGFQGGGLRASIQSEGDALAEDNVAYAYLPPKKKSKMVLVTRGNTYLQAALKLDPFIDVSVIDPRDYREDATVSAYVFDNFVPASQPAQPALIFGAAGASWLPKISGFESSPAFTTSNAEHPAMQFLSLHDVAVGKAAQIDAADVTVLAASGRAPLIVSSSNSKQGGRWVWATFDLQSSDFTTHESFPIFVDNVLAWFGREHLALRRTTGLVEIPIAGAQINGPDGKAVTSQSYADRTVFEATEPGLYTATKDSVRQYISVNLISRQFSSINHPALDWPVARQTTASRLRQEPWTYLVLLTTLLLGFEWWSYHRRITL